MLRTSYNFATSFCGGFFYLFMLGFLGMSYTAIAATDLVSNLVGLAAAPFWGRMSDRWGPRRLLAIALIAKAIFPFLWLLVLPQWWYLVFAVTLVRVFNTAQEVGYVSLALRTAPEQDRDAYISVDRGCNSLARAIAPALAALLALTLGDNVWKIGGYSVTPLHLLIFLSGVLRLASLVWLTKVQSVD